MALDNRDQSARNPVEKNKAIAELRKRLTDIETKLDKAAQLATQKTAFQRDAVLQSIKIGKAQQVFLKKCIKNVNSMQQDDLISFFEKQIKKNKNTEAAYEAAQIIKEVKEGNKDIYTDLSHLTQIITKSVGQSEKERIENSDKTIKNLAKKQEKHIRATENKDKHIEINLNKNQGKIAGAKVHLINKPDKMQPEDEFHFNNKLHSKIMRAENISGHLIAQPNPTNDKLQAMMKNIRAITPNDLAQAADRLNQWNTKKYDNEQKRWNAFLKALPSNVKTAFLAMHDVDNLIRQQVLLRTKKDNFGADEIADGWKNALVSAGISMNKNDLDEVYTKLSFMYGQILNQYTSNGEVGHTLPVVARVKDNLSAIFELNKVLGNDSHEKLQTAVNKAYVALHGEMPSDEVIKAVKIEQPKPPKERPKAIAFEEDLKLAPKVAADAGHLIPKEMPPLPKIPDQTTQPEQDKKHNTAQPKHMHASIFEQLAQHHNNHQSHENVAHSAKDMANSMRQNIKVQIASHRDAEKPQAETKHDLHGQAKQNELLKEAEQNKKGIVNIEATDSQKKMSHK